MRKLYQQALSRVRRFKADKDGATAIEFAFLAIPFFTLLFGISLLFGILELAIIFFLSSTLSHAVGEAGRLIRVGNFQNCGQAAFKTAVCSRMNAIGNCEDSLRIDVVSDTTFNTINLVDPPLPPVAVPGSPAPAIPNGVYNPTVAGDPVVVRALFYHKLLLPPQLTRLENVPGSGSHVVTSTTAFRNEPFPTQACGSAPTPTSG